MSTDMTEYPEYLLAQGDAARLPLASKSVDLVLGSPPYCDARTYGIGAQRDATTWVDWMLEVTREAVRVSRGLVLWVCAGVTRDHCYWPAPEGLLYRWWKAGGQCWRPVIWHRVGIPGSGGKKWLRSDVEYVLCFKDEGNDFFTDNTACGKPPKYHSGGAATHRLADGTRVSMQHTKKKPNGTIERQEYIKPELVNPGNYHEWGFAPDEDDWLENAVIKVTVGGGHLGSIYAHESEAPFPESLVEFFVKSFSPPGGLVCDPFGGSGTTAAVALKNDRRAIGFDLRRSQSELGHRRIGDSLRPVSKLDAPKAVKPLAGQQSLF